MSANVYISTGVGTVQVMPTDPDDDTAGFDIIRDSEWSNGLNKRFDRQTAHVADAAAIDEDFWAGLVAAADTAVNA